MSSSEFPFRVNARGREFGFAEAKIIVYDGFDRKVAEGRDELNLKLPRGLYTVRTERFGMIIEEVIRHDEKGTATGMEVPARVSPVPTFDTATTHEYYAYTSMDWSGRDTRPPILSSEHKIGTGRLFVFIRTPDVSHFNGEDLAASLVLYDSAGISQATFDVTETQRSNDGWVALSAEAAPGFYVLHHEGERPRCLILHVLENWSTQLFVTFDDHLRFETVVILLPALDKQFNPDDRIAAAVDAALSGLQEGRNDLTGEPLQLLLDGKFEDPMLGLVGAHLLLMNRDPDRHQVGIILNNLTNLIPDSPDVGALIVEAADRFGERIPDLSFPTPPFFRSGLEAVVRASADHPGLVPEGSLTEKVLLRLYIDSPWTSWRPHHRALDKERSTFRWREDEEKESHGHTWPEDVRNLHRPRAVPQVDEDEQDLRWLVEFVRERAKGAPSRPTSDAQLAKEVGVTRSLIQKAKSRI